MATAKRTKFQVRSDAAKQRWVRDDLKEGYWRKHIAAWKRSGMSKRGYCKANNLSESSFNAWNREISLREREYAPTANAAAILSANENHCANRKYQPRKYTKLFPESVSVIIGTKGRLVACFLYWMCNLVGTKKAIYGHLYLT